MQDDLVHSIDKANLNDSLKYLKEYYTYDMKDLKGMKMLSIIEEGSCQECNPIQTEDSTCVYKDEEWNIKVEHSESHNGPYEQYEQNNANFIPWEKIPYDLDFEKIKGEYFCEALFISGVNEDKLKFLKDSDSFASTCCHKDCSVLPSFKPNLLFNFPQKNFKNFEINESFSSLAFPMGVKICYGQNEESLKSQTFTSIITNVTGERLYLVTKYFYAKVDYLYFTQKYSLDPIKEYFRTCLDKASDDTIVKVSKFINSDSIYLPYSVSLISSYPNSSAMEKTLDSIILLINNRDYSMLHSTLVNVVFEVPVPKLNSCYNFYLSTGISPISIYNTVYDNKPTFNFDDYNLLHHFSIENILLIQRLLLLENKIIFVNSEGDLETLSKVCESFMSILYPLNWVHMYIPILPNEMLKYVQSFLPFVIGIDSSMLPMAVSYLDYESEVYLVNIKDNTLQLYKEGKFTKIKNSDLLPNFPKQVEHFLVEELKDIKEFESSDFRIETFTKFMTILFEDYKKYSVIIDSVPSFNDSNFIQSRVKSDQEFYKDFLDTQNFRQFIQSSYLQSEALYFHFFESLCSKFRSVYGIEKKNNVTVTRFGLDLNRFSRKNIEMHQKTHLLDDQYRKKTYTNSNAPQIDDRKRKSTFPTPKRGTDYATKINSRKCTDEKNETLNYSYSFDYSIGQEDVENYIFSKFNCNENKFQSLDVAELNKAFTVLNEQSSAIKEINKYLISRYDCYGYIEHSYGDSSESSFAENKSDLYSSNYSNKRSPTKQKNYLNNQSDLYSNPNHTLHGEDEIYVQMQNLKMRRKTIIKSESPANKINTKPVYRKQSIAYILSNSSGKNVEAIKQKLDEVINDYANALFSSNIKDDNFDVALLLNSRHARNKLAKILYQEKFKDNDVHLLDEMSFNSLKNLLFNCLLYFQCEPLDYEDVRLITKSTFFYYKHHNEKSVHLNLYLYKELTKGKGVFSVWLDPAFWSYYVVSDLEENSSLLGNNFTNIDAYNFNVICKVANEMNELKLESDFIYTCLVEKIAKSYIKKEFLLKDLGSYLKRIRKS